MIWYRAFDFFRTRNGQVLVFSVMLAGMFVAAARIHKARQAAKADEKSQLPQLSQDEFWENSQGDGHFGKNEKFEIEEVNSRSRPFRIPPKKELRPKLVREEEIPKMLEESFSPLPSLIAFQRSTPASTPEKDSVVDAVTEKQTSFELETGRLLYCQLLAPVSSEQGSAPVLAQLTKSYVVDGRVLLPVGTRVTGQLQGANGERLNFNNQWIVTLPTGEQVKFSGQLQEAAYGAAVGTYLMSDGLAGLPGMIAQKEEKPKKWNGILSTFVGAARRLAKDRVQTEVGEVVPASGRNVAIDGSSALLEELLGEEQSAQGAKQVIRTVSAGLPFYLFITGNEPN